MRPQKPLNHVIMLRRASGSVVEAMNTSMPTTPALLARWSPGDDETSNPWPHAVEALPGNGPAILEACGRQLTSFRHLLSVGIIITSDGAPILSSLPAEGSLVHDSPSSACEWVFSHHWVDRPQHSPPRQEVIRITDTRAGLVHEGPAGCLEPLSVVDLSPTMCRRFRQWPGAGLSLAVAMEGAMGDDLPPGATITLTAVSRRAAS